MALAAGNVMLASDFIALKARVKAECARRKYVGSVASYAGAAYDYTVTPAAGNPILAEHYNKIVTPMNAIMNTGYTTKKAGDVIPALNSLSTMLSKLEAEAIGGATSSCKSSCTGLCKGACDTACTGCTGGCQSSCSSSCSGGCTGCTSCSGSCSGGCSTDACRGGCSSSCSTTCRGGCRNTCAYGTVGGPQA